MTTKGSVPENIHQMQSYNCMYSYGLKEVSQELVKLVLDILIIIFKDLHRYNEFSYVYSCN